MSENYASLKRVFALAVDQAENGKGKERHANGEPFEKQKICQIARWVGSGYTIGQAVKKAIESQRLPSGRKLAELLGAMNYLAAEYIVAEEQIGHDQQHDKRLAD